MSDFRIDQISNQAGTAGPDIAGITTFSSTSGMLMPSGVTEYRGGRGRGLFGGGQDPANSNVIQYITISSTGNSLDFGDLTIARDKLGSCASSVRGIFGGGEPTTVRLDYVSISSPGNAFIFGDLTQARRFICGTSNSTRGIFAGGYNPGLSPLTRVSTIDVFTIASLGNAIKFGDLVQETNEPAACSSPTRSLIGGGAVPGVTNVISYITISTLGNSIDFGDRTIGVARLSACSNSIRGIFGGGTGGGSEQNVIDYVTIASIGDAIDFGDLTQSRSRLGACSSSSRGIFGGGLATPVLSNVIDFITITTTGNATDFGDLLAASSGIAACSDAHGGLGD
jgi:hypothetical protein